MFRIMSIATLVMIAICFFIGAGLAFADEGQVETTVGAEQMNGAVTDEYDFSDYLQAPTTTSTIPAVDAESIEEPELDRLTTIAI